MLIPWEYSEDVRMLSFGIGWWVWGEVIWGKGLDDLSTAWQVSILSIGHTLNHKPLGCVPPVTRGIGHQFSSSVKCTTYFEHYYEQPARNCKIQSFSGMNFFLRVNSSSSRPDSACIGHVIIGAGISCPSTTSSSLISSVSAGTIPLTLALSGLDTVREPVVWRVGWG